MATVQYVSRIREEMRARDVTVSDLHRRLADRGIHVSRGALDRIASDQPITEVSLLVVMPVLEEIGLRFEDAFRRVDDDERIAREEARARAARIVDHLRSTGKLSTREPKPGGESADTRVPELEQAIGHARKLLRARHPELFDGRGRLRHRAFQRMLQERFADHRQAAEEEYAALVGAVPPLRA